MNRIMGRARIMLVLILILALGVTFFLGEYAFQSKKWVKSPGSPHIFNGENLGCGQIMDRDGTLLLDLRNNRTYAKSPELRMSTLHLLGDRKGNISAPVLANYAMQIAGYDSVNGVYAYGGVGGQVSMTISAPVQIAALEALGDYKGTVGIYNYKTGELICAVSTPTFDPDNVPDIAADKTGKWDGVYLNRFTQGTYTPGSIYKVVTAAVAMETIPDIMDQTFKCTGKIEYGIDKVTCEKKHGKQSFKEAFGNSCNCAFAQIAEQIGGNRLQEYAERFGVTSSVKFDGVETAKGNLEAAGAADVSVAWSSIGQHKDLINPCTFLSYVGAIANGGVSITPYMVNRITVAGKPTYEVSPETTGRIMSPETAEKMKEFMRNNTKQFYGDDNFPGLNVCAKSGTAQVGGDKKPNAMFTGFVADEEYPLAFIVAVEDAGYGRPTCVPIISKILQVCKMVMDNDR